MKIIFISVFQLQNKREINPYRQPLFVSGWYLLTPDLLCLEKHPDLDPLLQIADYKKERNINDNINDNIFNTISSNQKLALGLGIKCILNTPVTVIF